jgi:hydrogenase expression/formation protein HypE
VTVVCPLPLDETERVVMAHGGGGRASHDLLARVFLPAFDNPILAALEDQATLEAEPGRLAFTTDSFVVRPLFFPGGDIGRLAICGTVNDLCVGGAIPRFVAAAFVLEEGLLLGDLARVVASMQAACREAEVTLVAGDTKVVERGKADGLYITTSGIGFVPSGRSLSVAAARPGDAILVSGTIGDHGMAILALREGIGFETVLASDCAPLTALVQALLHAAPGTRLLRDATRGGVLGVLHELSTASATGLIIDEAALPIRDEVASACEMLGLDPLYVANEGKLVAVVPEAQCAAALAAMRHHPLGQSAARIGTVTSDARGTVRVRSHAGGERLARLPAGEQLPRIC